MTSHWSTDTITSFNIQIYKDLIMREHITSNELCKKYYGNEVFGYEAEVDNHRTKLKDRYFIETKDARKCPIEVKKVDKFSHSSQVFKLVTECETKAIPVKKCMTFNEMVTFYASYGHSNYNHWLLARIIAISAYCERLNIRLVSEASFGKDALVDILALLNGNVSNLYKATLAKLKYALNNDMIIINELGALRKDEVAELQTYLLQALAYKPRYENNSRQTKGTKESMDLSTKSHIIFHNTPEYYRSKGQKYFEEVFTKAVMDRAPALLLDGYVTEDFSKSYSINHYDPTIITKLKQFIATLNYFKQNHEHVGQIKDQLTQKYKPKFEYDENVWNFKKIQKQRTLRSFNIITKWVMEFSEDQEQFNKIVNTMKESKESYNRMVKSMNMIYNIK